MQPADLPPLPAAGMKRKSAVRILSIGVWVIALGWIAYAAWPYRSEILQALRNADPVHFLYAFFWYLLALLATILAWIALIRPYAPGVNGWTHVWIYCLTLVSRRLPGTIWYVVGRMALYKNLGISRTNVTYASSLELVISFSTSILVSLVFIPSAFADRFGSQTPWYVLGATLAAAVMLTFSPRGIAWLAGKFRRAVPERLPRANVVTGILAYLAMWITSGMMLSQIAAAFEPFPPGAGGYMIGTMALSSAMGTLTIFLPSSFGISDLSIAFLLVQFFSVSTAGLSALMTRVLGTAFDLLVAGLFVPFYRLARSTTPDPDQGMDPSK